MAIIGENITEEAFKQWRGWVEAAGGISALDPQAIKRGRLDTLKELDAEQSRQYFHFNDQPNERGASLYDDDRQDPADFPWAYPEHPDFRKYFPRSSPFVPKTEKELFEERQKAQFSSFFDSNLLIPSFGSPADTDSEDFVLDTVSDGKFEKLNLGTPKSFVDIRREKLLEKQQNENDSIFDETTKPRRLREDVLRKLFANFGSPESNFSNIGFVPQGLPAIEQIKRGVFQPSEFQFPQVEPPESLVPKSTIQNILQPDQDDFSDVTTEKNVLQELSEQFKPSGFVDVSGQDGFDDDFAPPEDPDFAEQAEAAARGEGPIPGLEESPEVPAIVSGIKAGLSREASSFVSNLPTTAAKTAIGLLAPATTLPVSTSPIVGYASMVGIPVSPLGIAFSLGSSAFAAYNSPYSGFGPIDILQGALYGLLPGSSAEDFFAEMTEEQEEFDLLVEDVFSNPFVTTEDEMDKMLGRGFFGAEGEHNLSKTTDENAIQSAMRAAKMEEHELDIDVDPFSDPGSIVGPTAGFPTEAGYDYGTLPSKSKGFFDSFFSFFQADPPAPEATQDAYAGAMGFPDDDEDDPSHGTSGVGTAYGSAFALSDDAAFGDPGDDPSESADQATDSDADGDSW
jgi:hypothetical protein